MRLEGCVRRDVMMDLEGLPLEMMSADANSTMMSANVHERECAQIKVFIRRMTLWGSTDL